MITEHDLTLLPGASVIGAGGHKIGKVADVYESADGGAVGTFVTVTTGLFGGHASFVPLDEATRNGDTLVVPYEKDLVTDAPRVAADEELSTEEEDRLYAHYGLGTSGTSYPDTTSTTSTTSSTDSVVGGARGTVGHDTSGPTTDDAMTRSEERLQVGTQRVEAGRARLRKRIVTETETVTVPVSHDEVRVVREPVSGVQAGDRLELSEEVVEVVVRAEAPVVTKETVPVERVRLDTETVRDEVRIEETVRSEQIEVEGDVDDSPRR